MHGHRMCCSRSCIDYESYSLMWTKVSSGYIHRGQNLDQAFLLFSRGWKMNECGFGVLGQKPVGIISLYYKNYNCGGLLQSLALCRAIGKLGTSAEQICYDRGQPNIQTESFRRKLLRSLKTGTFFLSLKTKVAIRLHRGEIEAARKYRAETFTPFEKMIPHSAETYDSDNIASALDWYSCFVTGSDQVWSWALAGVTDESESMSKGRIPYFLNFVPDDVKKVAYAASISCPYIPDKLQPFYFRAVERLDAVSLRERSSLELFPEEIRKKIDVVVDPTMLLTGDEWASTLNLSSCPVEGKFIFCYLLDPSKKEVKDVKKISKILGLPIVMRPNMTCSPVSYDKKLADIPDYDMGPTEFVNYIRNATLVVTNSFHGSVFSILFHTPFFVVKRLSKVSMHSRIESLLGDYGLEDRLLEHGFDEALVRNHLDVDWTYVDSQLEKNRKYSMDWLKRALEN